MRIGNPQSFNRYHYAQNDPVNYTDSSGLDIYLPLPFFKRPPGPPRSFVTIYISPDPYFSPSMDYGWGGMILMEGFEIEQDPIPQPHPSPSPSLNPRNQRNFGRCFNGWRFGVAASQPFVGTRFHGAVKATATFLEIGPPISLGGDAAATAAKASRSGIGGTTKAYASGLNWFFRHTAGASVKGDLIKFGDKATPILSSIGAFTAGYNASVAAQCALGVIQ
jgi:hypothetical protein